MAGFDGNIQVTVTIDQPAVPPAGFGVPLLAATGLGVGFTERVRFYPTNDPSVVSDDLAAGDITQSVADALNAGIAQTPKVPLLAVGRIEADVAQVDTVTLAGGVAIAAEVFTISINGTDYTFPAVGAETPAALAAALAPLVAADPNVSAVDSGGGVVTITSLVAGTPFTTAVSTDSAGITMAAAVLTPNVSIFTELDAIRDDTPDFYAVHPTSRAALQLQRVADWVLVNDRLALLQSSDADLITSATTSIADDLKTQSNDRAAVVYHSIDTEWSAYAWLAKKLAADPDNVVTIWAYATLVGITPQKSPVLTATGLINLLAKDGNVYATFGGSGSTGMGRLANALPIDLRITADWAEVRMNENLTRLLKETSDRNERVNYDDGGIAKAAAELRDILEKGERTGHFNTNSSTITVPIAAEVPQPTKMGREVILSFETVATGAIEKATVTGNILR